MVDSAILDRGQHPSGAPNAMGAGGRARPDRAVRTSLCYALMGGLLLPVAARGEAQPAVKQVLLLQSFGRGYLAIDNFTGDFRVGLDQRAGKPVNVIQVVVGPIGFVGPSEQSVVDYIRAIFTDQPPPDLIMTVAGPAAVFARKHRRELFPETPLVLASVDQRYLGAAPLGDNETAVPVVNDFPRLVDDMLSVLPETKQVFMVIGAGALGRFWREALEGELTRFRGRVTFIWSDALSLPEMLSQCSRLPSHSAILYLTFGTDAAGGAYPDEQVLAALHARANAPLFGALSPLFGHGVVGGSMMSIEDLSRNTAEVVSRILNGAPAKSVRIPPQFASRPMFDWREMQRWDIPDSRLPPGSEVRYRGPTLWGEHRVAVLTSIGALTLQSLLIAWLLYERRARRRAELESRRNLALAADASRRETMSALTASIGHELGQPLTSLKHNAQALLMKFMANQATPEEIGEVLTDLQSEAALASEIIDRHRTMLRSRELDRKPVDLRSVIDRSLALLAHEIRARQVEATIDLPSIPCAIEGDQVLLQQVLVNLVRNAVDAMADTPAGKRRITIRSACTGTEVELSVRDAGTGLPPKVMETLFTPFVTTRSNGLGIGLTITRSIVEAHGGTIAAHGNPEGGATFAIRLPCRATRRLGGPLGAADAGV